MRSAPFAFFRAASPSSAPPAPRARENTRAFSKKVENRAHAISIYFTHYNFVKQHAAHRLSPAMAAGVADKLWSLEDIVRIVDEHEMRDKDPTFSATSVGSISIHMPTHPIPKLKLTHYPKGGHGSV